MASRLLSTGVGQGGTISGGTIANRTTQIQDKPLMNDIPRPKAHQNSGLLVPPCTVRASQNHARLIRFHEIDLLRFLAALSVLIFHYTYRGTIMGIVGGAAFQ